jgi:DNA polymerase III epsilon subunit-like protein
MNYLFFDCECANNWNRVGKICSFGYAIFDSDFHLLQKKDILINPRAPFDKKVLGGKKARIALAYPADSFYAQKDFAYFYPTIRFLLTQPNMTVLGYSLKDDIAYLSQECKRYKLEMASFRFIDVQTINQKATAWPTPESLEKACARYEVDTTSLQFHKSCDDAEMSGLLLKAIAHRIGFSLADALAYFPSAASDVQTLLSQPKGRSKRYRSRRHLNLPLASDFQEKNEKLNALIQEENQVALEGPLNGEAFSVSCLVKEDINTAIALCERIKSLGGRLAQSLKKADYIVVYDDEEKVLDAGLFDCTHLQILTLKEAEELFKNIPQR